MMRGTAIKAEGLLPSFQNGGLLRTLFWVQGLEEFAGRLRAAGASFPVTGAAASAALLRGSAGATGGSTGIVRVGAALYGQQEIVPGTRPAARWLTRIANLKQARSLTAWVLFDRSAELLHHASCMHHRWPQVFWC